MLAVDLAVIAVVVGLCGIGASYVLGLRKKRKAEDPRARGEANAKRMEADEALRCAICVKTINPDVDIYAQGSWWHKGCYRDVME